MVRLLMLVEGPTEARFVTQVLTPHLGQEKFCVYIEKPSMIITRENPQGRNHTGGRVTFDNLIKQLKSKLASGAYLTTLFDYYACGWEHCENTVEQLEAVIKNSVQNNPLLIPYIQKYEFEGLLFSQPVSIATTVGNQSALSELIQISNDFASPEDINNSRTTAPSKRLEKIFGDSYNKVQHGADIAMDICLSTIRDKCPRFNAWLTQLEQLGQLAL